MKSPRIALVLVTALAGLAACKAPVVQEGWRPPQAAGERANEVRLTYTDTDEDLSSEDAEFYGIGYSGYFNKNFSLGADFYAADIDAVDADQTFLILQARYHFLPDSVLSPYIGPDVGWARLSGLDDNDDFDTTYGGAVGVKINATEALNLFLEYYTLITDFDQLGLQELDGLRFGIGWRF